MPSTMLPSPLMTLPTVACAARFSSRQETESCWSCNRHCASSTLLKQPFTFNQPSSQGDGTPDQYDLPAPSKGGALPPSPATSTNPGQANGHIHQDDKSRYEDRVGWAPRFGQDSITEVEAQESPLDHQTWVESKLDNKFFGGKVHRAPVTRHQ